MCVSPSQHTLLQKFCAKSAPLQYILKKGGIFFYRGMYSISDISKMILSGVMTLQ